jgi:hypothetical protein
MREKSIEKYLKDQVESYGGMCKKWVSPGWNGAPDRIVLFPMFAAVFFVELKAPNGKLQPSQIQAHKQLQKMGHDVLVLNTKEKVKLWIDLQMSVFRMQVFSCPPTTGIITNISAPVVD